MLQKIKSLVFISFFIITLFIPLLNSQAKNITTSEQKQVDVFLFWAEGCPHCAAEKEFLKKLDSNPIYQGKINLHKYEVSSLESKKKLREFAQKLNLKVSAVPITIIKDWYIVGFSDNIGRQIQNKIDESLDNYSVAKETKNKQTEDKEKIDKIINVPFLGKVDLKKLSLPVLTVVIGLLDGFNPCAMWTLIFLISLLLGMKNKKRMWLLGSVFIIASGAVYFFFMVAWLNFILFVGFVFWVRLAIALVALIAGSLSLKKFWNDRNGGCEVSESKERKKIFEKIKNIVNKRTLWLALGGIILLAFTVNLVELLCSAGFPAIYIQILALNHLSAWQYYGYIFLYIFFFMLDDLIVFIIAMLTLHLTGVSTKYSRWSNLIGGLLMVIIGLLLIFKHQWLMFG